jgi:alpha/beta superfamily hydrolase
VETVTFMTEDGVRLEGELRLPDGTPRATAVVCHPHPKHGGSKDHPILWAMRNELAGVREIAVLAFNFRGVMGSGGVYGGGHDERKDVLAAIVRIREVAPERPTVLLGWYFGANVALRTALDQTDVEALVMIGIPLRPKDLTLPPLPGPSELLLFHRPALVLCGDNDEYCPVADADAFTRGFPDGRLEVVEGTDHFLWRHEKEAATIVGDFVEAALDPGA